MRTLTVIFLFFVYRNVYSQQDTTAKNENIWERMTKRYLYSNDNDTITKKGIRFRVTNLAIQGNLGAITFFYDKRTEKYYGNNWSFSEEIFIYYKNFFYAVSGSTIDLNMKETLHFTNETLDKGKPLTIFRTNLLLGYNFNLPNNFSIAPYAAILTTGFSSEHTFYNDANGFGCGFFFNKFIPLQPRRYLVLYINSNFNQAYYSKFNSALDDNFFSVSFGLGYKAWFLKRIKTPE